MANSAFLDLHWELIRETCVAFDVELQDYEATSMTGDIVQLVPNGGLPLAPFDWPADCTILIGCDDDFKPDDILPNAIPVTIETPVPYYLWSGVALGIALYDYRRKI